jgi:hypothetical protein
MSICVSAYMHICMYAYMHMHMYICRSTHLEGGTCIGDLSFGKTPLGHCVFHCMCLATSSALGLGPCLDERSTRLIVRRALGTQLKLEPPRQLPQLPHLGRLRPREPRRVIDDRRVGDEAQQLGVPAAELAERALAPTASMRAACQHPCYRGPPLGALLRDRVRRRPAAAATCCCPSSSNGRCAASRRDEFQVQLIGLSLQVG